MNNCLLTKLKESVNNDSLNYLDSITINVSQVENPNYNQRNLYFSCVSPGITVKVVSGDVYFTNSDGSQNQGTEITISDGNLDLYFSNHTGKVIVTDKYNIIYIKSNYNSVGYEINLDTADFAGYNSNSLNLAVYNVGKGSLPKNVKYSSVNAYGSTELTGDISELDLALCENISTALTSIYGTLSSIPNVLTLLEISACNIALNVGILGGSNVSIFRGDSNPKIIGNFANMSNGKYTEISIRDSGVSGTVESFVEAEWQGGRRTGICKLMFGLSITFHETSDYTVYLYLEYGNDGVKVYKSNSSGSKLEELASYNGSTWTYNS